MASIADFIPQMQEWIRKFSNDNQEIMSLVNQVQFDSDKAIKWGISVLGNGAGNMMNTTMSAVGSLVSGFATFFIAFSFACYILFQKEKLHVQIRKIFFAFIPKQKATMFLDICSLTYRTFANFLTGQCVEAVILGSMFRHYIKYFENAICTFNWNLNCIYCINPCFWGVYRVRNGMFFDFYGESQTGNFVYCCISCFTAN